MKLLYSNILPLRPSAGQELFIDRFSDALSRSDEVHIAVGYISKAFYVLRPILACRWILEKQTPPPMLFSTLADACLDEALVPAVTDLLRLKMETPEIGLGPRIDIINDYLDASIEEVDQLIQAIPGDEKVTWDELNRLFLKTVRLTD